MKALVWTAVDSIELRQVPAPRPDVDHAIVKVKKGGICGSDLTIIAGKHPRAKAPVVLGHEFTGTVDQLSVGYSGELAVGDRVVVEPLISCGECRQCRNGNRHVCERLALLGIETDGAFAEYVAAPVNRIYPIPAELTDGAAALIEPLAVAVHAVDYGALDERGDVLVLGAGPIGLLVAQVARHRTSGRIWVCEIVPERLRRARELGFETIDSGREGVVEAVLSRTGGRGASVTFDAAGVPFSCETMIDATAIKGRIVMVAIHKNPCNVLFQQLSYREQTIHGTRVYAEGDFATAIELSSSGAVDPESIVTHTFAIEEAIRAFEIAGNPTTSCKVLIEQ